MQNFSMGGRGLASDNVKNSLRSSEATEAKLLESEAALKTGI